MNFLGGPSGLGENRDAPHTRSDVGDHYEQPSDVAQTTGPGLAGGPRRPGEAERSVAMRAGQTHPMAGDTRRTTLPRRPQS